MIRYTFVICLLSFLFSCKTGKEAIEQVDSPVDQGRPEKRMIIAEIGDTGTESDPISITSAEIIGNSLLLEVSYSGGCQRHDYRFIGSASIAKSLPPIRSVKLVHDNHDDNCKMMVTEHLEIDLRPLAYQQESGSVIYLTLDGWKQQLTYTFQ